MKIWDGIQKLEQIPRIAVMFSWVGDNSIELVSYTVREIVYTLFAQMFILIIFTYSLERKYRTYNVLQT